MTPYYNYDISLLRRTLDACLNEASRYGYQVHYALKANVEPVILREISARGFGADCVSGWEVQAAVENGFAPDKVVFAGVGKSDLEINYALDQDIFSFNCESLQELKVINELAGARGKVATIALRINPDINPDTHRYIATGQKESKFGISYTEVNEALDKLRSLSNLRVVGIHFHIGSQILDMGSFAELARRAGEISDWFFERGVAIEHLNMGGGLGIDYIEPEKNPLPDFAAYFKVFDDNLRLRPSQKVHFELGRSLVAQCCELRTRVLITKRTGGGANFIIVDAGMTELIRPALYQAHHKVVNLSAEGENRPVERYYIGGPICESSDIFARDIEFPHTERGDILAIKSVGAYGSTMASNYNMRPSAKAVFNE